MTLNVDMRKCPPESNKESMYTYGVMSMVVGMPEVTEDNVEEFFRRVNSMELLTGPFRNRIDEDGETWTPYLLTAAEARTLIGMRTNVSATTPTKFKKHLWETYLRLVPFG